MVIRNIYTFKPATAHNLYCNYMTNYANLFLYITGKFYNKIILAYRQETISAQEKLN